MYVGVTVVRSVVAELQRQGVALPTLAARAGISCDEIAEGVTRVPLDRYDRLLKAARELSRTPALGLCVGAQAPAGALNVVGYILATCGTLREAMREFLRYSPLIKESARWELVEHGEVARFRYAHDGLSAESSVVDAEAALALVLKIGRQLVGDLEAVDAARFRHPTPPYASEYTRVFGRPAEFAQPANELVFPRRLLDVEQPLRDDQLRAHLQERAEALLKQRASGQAFLEHVRVLVRLEVESGAPQLSRLAARLGLSLRTLERQVRDEGCSLAALLADARREAACAALGAPLASIKDVAYQLGFSEPSAFHRAFKRWTGTTPAQYREALGQGARPRR